MRVRSVPVLLLPFLLFLALTVPETSRAEAGEIAVENLRINRGTRELPARLYRPQTASRQAGLLLIPGIVPGGIDDERLVRFARFLARQGFVVLTPEVSGAQELRLDTEAVGDVVAAFDLLASIDARVDPKRIGIWGICIGGGYGLAAAERPELRERVAFLVAHDSYFDLRNLIWFLFTGKYQFDDVKGRLAPNRYARGVALKNYLHVVYDGADRDRVLQAVDRLLDGKDREATALASGLSPEGRGMVEMILSPEPPDAQRWAETISREKRKEIASISPSTDPQAIRCPVYLLHTKSGTFVPYTETLALAATLRRQGTECTVLITDVLDHVTFTESGISFGNRGPALAQEVMELSLFLNAIIKRAK